MLTKYVPAGVEAPVVMVTVDVPEPPGTAGGVKLQLAPPGKPLQDSVTAVLKPFEGASVTVVAAVAPATMLSGATGAAEIAKSGTVGPLTLISVISPTSLGGL